jgi:hypothetical protein
MHRPPSPLLFPCRPKSHHHCHGDCAPHPKWASTMSHNGSQDSTSQMTGRAPLNITANMPRACWQYGTIREDVFKEGPDRLKEHAHDDCNHAAVCVECECSATGINLILLRVPVSKESPIGDHGSSVPLALVASTLRTAVSWPTDTPPPLQNASTRSYQPVACAQFFGTPSDSDRPTRGTPCVRAFETARVVLSSPG